MADKQPSHNQAMRKLPIPPLPTSAYTTKTSKQKKTNEEKQAKKKELNRAALRGGAFEAGLERSREGGGGTWKLYYSNFEVHSPLNPSDFSFNA